MATEAEEREAIREPGMAVALLTVLAIIVTIAVISVLVWVLMIGVAATTSGRQGASPLQAGPLIDQKGLPAKQP